ncbi:MAG: M16 family metallopeptidase [Bacillota bacterium]
MIKRIAVLFLLFLVISSLLPVLAAQDFSRIDRTTVNGMNILLQKNGSKLVEVALLLKSGSGLDPVDRKGVALIMNELVMLNLLYNSKVELGEVNVETNPDFSLITIKTTSDKAEKALEKVKELLSYPLYSYDIISDLKEIYGTDIKGIPALTKSYFEFTKEFYGQDHPYNNWVDPDSIAAISGTDVYRWYRQTYQPGNAILAISGGCRQNIEQLEKLFSDIRSEQVDRRLLIKPVLLDKDLDLEEEDPNGRGTSIVIGFSAPRIQDPEYPAFRVIAYYLEEYQHYFEELREKEGLIYTEIVYYNYLEKPKAPNIVFATMTDPESLKTVELKTLGIVKQLAETGIEQAEIAKVVKAMKAEITAKKASGKGLAYLNALSQYLQTQLVYDENLAPKLEQVKTEDIKKAAAKYLQHYIKVAYIPKKLAEDL